MPLAIRGVCPLLFVFDMPTSLAFYRDLLGFRIVQAAPPNADGDRFGWAWLRHGDDTELMLNTCYDSDAERPTTPDVARVAAHGDTALYIGCPDVDGAYRHLRASHLDVAAPTVTPYGMRQLHVTDPDGFALCFQWPAAEHAAAG